MPEKMITIICDHCDAECKKPEREIKRQRKKGRTNFYCSLSCSKKDGGADHLKEWKFSDGNKAHLKRVNTNQRDEFSDFRLHLNKVRQRNKEVDIDLQYLKEVWETQEGRCVYTGVHLVHTPYDTKAKDYNYAASLDRKDNCKGYVKGNIQFISVSCNWLKNRGNDSHINAFFDLVVESRSHL